MEGFSTGRGPLLATEVAGALPSCKGVTAGGITLDFPNHVGGGIGKFSGDGASLNFAPAYTLLSFCFKSSESDKDSVVGKLNETLRLEAGEGRLLGLWLLVLTIAIVFGDGEPRRGFRLPLLGLCSIGMDAEAWTPQGSAAWIGDILGLGLIVNWKGLPSDKGHELMMALIAPSNNKIGQSRG